jgi:GNAT superfamily N-acetyltransferase
MKITCATNQEAEKYFLQIVKHLFSIWPPKNPHETAEDRLPIFQKAHEGLFERDIIAFEGNDIIGFARIFARPILVNGKQMSNMALENVSVQPKYRGLNIGALLVKEAFSFVDSQIFECSLFQTKVAGFYEKLGARIVTNPIINSLNAEKKPFWDPHILVYPKTYETGIGEIDLLGDGY